MTDMVARVHLVVDVPFSFTLGEDDEDGHNEDRISAARKAETDIIDSCVGKIQNCGFIVNSFVEEVREK